MTIVCVEMFTVNVLIKLFVLIFNNGNLVIVDELTTGSGYCNLGLCFQTNIQTDMPVPLLERDLLPAPEIRTACPEVRTVTPFRVSGRGKRGAVLPSPLAEELSPFSLHPETAPSSSVDSVCIN